MNRIKIVFSCTALSIIVLIVIQLVFLESTYSERKAIFEDRVFILLKNLKEALDPGDPLPEAFNRLLSQRQYQKSFPLLEKKIATYSQLENIQYAIYKKDTPDFVLGSTFKSTYLISLKADHIIVQLGFPDYGVVYHLQKMWIHILVSILSTALLIVSSYYTIITLIKQRRLSKTKEQFINTMAHELKTPIFSISIAVKTMLELEVFKENEKLNRYLQLIYSENERLKMNTSGVPLDIHNFHNRLEDKLI
ncbi:MAG: histidine kinase dimerization/phospho-acceptor domain-containing protein [Bacteroidota bacterium]